MLMYCKTCQKLIGGLDVCCPFCGVTGQAADIPQVVEYHPDGPALPSAFSFIDGNTYTVGEEYEKAFAVTDQKGQEVFISKWIFNKYFTYREQEDTNATA